MIKRSIKSFLALSLIVVSASFISCSENDDKNVIAPETKELNKDIVDLAVVTPDLSSLVAAVKKGGLVEALKGSGPFTVFAPKNDAFQALLDSNSKWNSLDDIDVELLKNVLKYHVVSGKVMAADLKEGQEVTTLNGEKFTINLKDGASINTINSQDVKIIKTDIKASNGIIHFVDAVLLPIKKEVEMKDIVDLAVATPELSTLVAAAKKAGLVEALKGSGPFTVFAPKNDAFQALLDSNSKWNSLDDIDVELLKNVLKYHVVSGKVMAADLKDGQEVTTLNGEKFTINLKDGASINTINSQDVKIIKTDIKASNGIIHFVDAVLLPIKKEVEMKDIVDLAVATPELSILVAAVKKAGLVEALKGAGPFTVFAPKNDAFQALLDSNQEWNSIDDIDVELLKKVLLYHVIPSKIMSKDISNGLSEQKTLLGQKLTFESSKGVVLKTAAGQSLAITGVDVKASNGVVHFVNAVMIPKL